MLNFPECHFDKGDCTWGNICNIDCRHKFSETENVEIQIQDGVCQNELDIEECCFDGGDCSNPIYRCPTCSIRLQSIHNWMGDGFCDSELDRPECCHDLNDCNRKMVNSLEDLPTNICTTCPIAHHNHLEDGLCDRYLFNSDCCFDGSDCDGVEHSNLCHQRLLLQDICPTCTEPGAFYQKRFSDGICDGVFKSPECCYDNNDCFPRSICPTCNFIGGMNVFSGKCDVKVSSTTLK